MPTATIEPDTPMDTPHEGQEEPRLYTLRDAAELCGTTYTALRKRADRGGIRTVKRDGVRYVPMSELERHGLLPDAEESRLAARVEELERELAEHRQLAERTESTLEAERAAREIAEAAMHEHRAAATTAAEVAAEHARRLAELEDRLTRASRGPLGFVRSWALAKEIAELRAEGEEARSDVG